MPAQGERARHRIFHHAGQRARLAPHHSIPYGSTLRMTAGIDDHDHFCDHNHLNAAGAALFTGQCWWIRWSRTATCLR
jgi:hypothetical protein